ncbi:uncharacterized protein L203_102873 [Cryptococcus depauperatus CBS 7841]|uniref:Uncharacterized protein n=1 Tax=Cryptococcus depauperatus CBS 7841 TaxID=1295531 RepID=A0A1E3IBG0_9TREE|nr:hypothetical protein L203_04678 [Cryptococcus depauperatus CBS 7841]
MSKSGQKRPAYMDRGLSASTLPNGPRSAPPEMAFTPMPAREDVALPVDGLQPLEKEIERLTAICEEHERAIRSTLSTVSHHLLTNLEGVFEKLAMIDDDAELITSSLQQSLQAHIPAFQAHLREKIKRRTADVQVMRERMTPWRDIVDERTDDGSGAQGAMQGSVTSHGKKLKRIEGGGGETDALTRVELWADEVEMYLNNEIMAINERIKIKKTRRYYIYHTVIYALIVLGIVATGFALYYPSAAIWSRIREWQRLHSSG